MLKTIIFDLGGVYFCDGTRIAIETIATKYKIDHKAVGSVLNGALGKIYRTGRISADQFWNQAKSEWKVQGSNADFSLLWCSSYQLNDGTVRLVERLKNAGHELLYLSDNTRERVEYLDKRYSFLKKFDNGVFSHIVNRKKPDPRIYKLILEKASHVAEDCVYIDDKPDYLKPAKDLGMKSIAFKDAQQLESALKKHLILP